MSRKKKSQTTHSPNRARSGRRIVLFTAMLLLLVSLPWFGQTSLAWWARMMAQTCIDEGAISAAQDWLDWSARLDPRDGATDLLRAACFRRLQQRDRWTAALALAEQKGVPVSLVRQETRLGQIEVGNFEGGVEGELAAMAAADAPPNDFCAALVAGCLAKKDPTWAKRVLDAWETWQPDEPMLAYMRGVYWLWMNEFERNIQRRREFLERAQQDFEQALAKQPRHEQARVALAGLLEDQCQLEEAAGLAAAAPPSEAAAVNTARLLRESDRLDEARRVLEPWVQQRQASAELAAQMAEIELESGRYQEADRWLALAGINTTERVDILRAAACSSSLQENPPRAQALFARIDAAHNYSVRLEDLLSRMTIGAEDPQTEAELRALEASRPGEPKPGTGQTAEGRQEGAEATAAELYTLHCSGCHGENGDGKGRAARHLFPKPRDLRTDRFRLVSTVNGVASLEDMEAGIRRGMPGTSMRAFDKLSEDQRMLLAQEVRRLNRLGIGEQFIDTLLKEGEEIDEDEVREVLKLRTTPGDDAVVPRIGRADPQAIARGKDAYLKLGCKNCHGEDGTGAGDMPLFDEKGIPSPPRDLAHEAFKGGHEPEAIYLRILLGMPGSPHPACPGVADDQLIDLVHYCRSLSQEPKRERSNHQRALQAWTAQYRVGEEADRKMK